MMNNLKDLTEQAVEFHGHLCPGLTMGVRMAHRTLEILGEDRAEDEELVAVVEMDSCAVDGIQQITGCTFGKGNLIFKDYGKTAVTFYHREMDEAVRLCLRPEAMQGEEISRAKEGDGGKREIAEIILSMPVGELLDEQAVPAPLFPLAQIHQSLICYACGESVMETRVVEKGGSTFCIPCSDDR